MKRKERFHFIGNALFHVCLEGKKLCLGHALMQEIKPKKADCKRSVQ